MTELFIKSPLALYRSGIVSVLGQNVVTLYNAIKCYVFRATDVGTLGLRKLAADGYLVAEIGQGKLAKLLGMKRQTVNKLLQQLEIIGWIKYDVLDVHRVCTYILGTWQLKTDGKREETHYADMFVGDMEMGLKEALAAREKQLPLHLRGQRGDDSTFREAEFDFRISFISNYVLNRGKQLVAKEYDKHPVMCFTPDKDIKQAKKNVAFIEALNSVGVVASRATALCALRAPAGVPTQDVYLCPERYTEIDNSSLEKEKDKKSLERESELHVVEEVEDHSFLKTNGKEELKMVEDEEDIRDLINFKEINGDSKPYEDPGPDTEYMKASRLLDIGSPLIKTKQEETLPLPPLMQEMQTAIIAEAPRFGKDLLALLEEKTYSTSAEKDRLVFESEPTHAETSQELVEQTKEELNGIFDIWEQKWEACIKTPVPAWSNRDWALLGRVVAAQGDNKLAVINAIKYMITYWESFRKRMNITACFPTVSIFRMCSDQLVKESKKIITHFETLHKVKKHKASGAEPDPELEYLYERAEKDLTEFGVKYK